MSFLQVSNLYKTFPEETKKAVKDVTFQLNKGHILGVLGESGCGKSTLLRLIAGFEQPDKGLILIDGDKVIGPQDKLLPGHESITLVHQHYELFPNHSVFENVYEALKTYEEDEIKAAQVNDMLDICRLAELADKFPRELSGGQQQRVALARALINNPELLLLDEPFSDLDTILKTELKKDIYEIIQQTQTTAILVTHDAKDALPICDEITVMRDGEFLQTGSPAEIYNHPVNEYVARFCGPISVFPYALLDENSGSMAAIRPEHIRFSSKTEGIPAVVTTTNYLGSHFEIILESENSVEWYVHTTEKPEMGQQVMLDLVLDKIMIM